jgi:hypothetical protein
VQVQLGLGAVQPAPLDAARVALDVPEAAAQPAHRDRVLAPVEVVVEQPGGRPGRAPVVADPPEGGAGTVAGGDRLAGPAQPPGRLGQGLQLARVEAGRVAGGELPVQLQPGAGARDDPWRLRARVALHDRPPSHDPNAGMWTVCPVP